MKISISQRFFVLILTLVTCLGAMCGYTPEANAEDNSTEIAANNGHDDDGAATAEINTVTLQAIINFVHIDIHFESYLIQELIQVSEIIHFGEQNQPVYNSGYFNTLFRLIISPNAP